MRDFSDEITYSDDTYTADQAPMNPPVRVVVPANDDAVSAQSAALVEAERAIATTHGFRHNDGDLYFVAGTKLAESGLQKSRDYAAEYAALPTVTEAATAHELTIAEEQRIDRKVNLRDWRLDVDGRLRSVKDSAIAASLTAHSWGQLCNQQPDDSTAIRGNVNGWIGDGTQNAENLARVRGPANAREIFAILSSGKRGYTVYDSHELLRRLADAMPGTKCRAIYSPDSTKFSAEVMIQAPIDISAFVGVGRVHRAGVKLVTADNGSEAIDLAAFLERIRCMNHTTTTEDTGRIRLRHTGDFKRLYAALRTLIGNMPKLIADLQGLWCRAATEHYLDSETGLQLSAPAALERLVLLGHLPTGGLETQTAIDAYTAAWRAEDSPHSAAGVIMAVQRASHEFSSTDTAWKASQWATETEEIASGMLYQTVSYTLDQPTA